MLRNSYRSLSLSHAASRAPSPLLSFASSASHTSLDWSYGQLLVRVAKIITLIVTVMSGAYTILGYYSSVGAFEQSVEANRLALLTFCASNNYSSPACNEVQQFLPMKQAVAEVFNDRINDVDSSIGYGSDDSEGDKGRGVGNNQGRSTLVKQVSTDSLLPSEAIMTSQAFSMQGAPVAFTSMTSTFSTAVKSSGDNRYYLGEEAVRTGYPIMTPGTPTVISSPSGKKGPSSDTFRYDSWLVICEHLDW